MDFVIFFFLKHGVVFLLFPSILAIEKILILKNFKVVRFNHVFHFLIYQSLFSEQPDEKGIWGFLRAASCPSLLRLKLRQLTVPHIRSIKGFRYPSPSSKYSLPAYFQRHGTFPVSRVVYNKALRYT